MRDNRYTRDRAPYEGADQGYPEDEWNGGYQGYGQDYDRQADSYGQAAGFNHHRSSGARRTPAENPVAGAAKRVGSAVTGLFANRASRQPRSSQAARPSRGAAMTDGGDYLGVGEACRACGKPVEHGQLRCPHCGAFVKPLYQNLVFWIAVVVLVVLVVVLSIGINSCRSNAGGSDTPAVQGGSSAGSDGSALATAVANAQSTLDAQETSRTYTRYSLNNLQHVVSAANAVLADETSTDEAIASALAEVNEALEGLVEIAADAPRIDYAEVAANLSAHLGEQVSLNGTVQEVGTGEDGVVSMSVAVSGDTAQIVYVNFESQDAEGVPEAGSDCTATGTVIGEYNGMPVVFADSVSAA